MKRKSRARFDRRRFLRSPAFWLRVKLLLRRLLGAIRWHAFRLDARIGLDDPADTGMLWGLIAPVLASVVPPHVNMTLRPDFERAVLAFEAEGEIRVVPLRVIWIVASFLASPRSLRVLKQVRRPT